CRGDSRQRVLLHQQDHRQDQPRAAAIAIERGQLPRRRRRMCVRLRVCRLRVCLRRRRPLAEAAREAEADRGLV
ncbi:MAG TPA: hypothetical protein VJJ70_13175, partial [Anaerolineales bacterium]|nr:hypothetical protein [Anaerolineales bacterium]